MVPEHEISQSSDPGHRPHARGCRAVDRIPVAVPAPALDVLAEGTLAGRTATYRLAVRNHGASAVGPVEINLEIPDGAPLAHRWLGAEGLGRCAKEGRRL